MRTIAIALTLSYVALQSPPPTAPTASMVQFISTALAVVGLATAIYRLGALNEQNSNTTRRCTDELTRFGGELTAVKQSMTALAEQRVALERSQERIELRLEALVHRVELLESALHLRTPEAA